MSPGAFCRPTAAQRNWGNIWWNKWRVRSHLRSCSPMLIDRQRQNAMPADRDMGEATDQAGLLRTGEDRCGEQSAHGPKNRSIATLEERQSFSSRRRGVTAPRHLFQRCSRRLAVATRSDGGGRGLLGAAYLRPLAAPSRSAMIPSHLLSARPARGARGGRV